MKQELRNKVDYADVIHDVAKELNLDLNNEDLFYFYEECQDTGILKDCETYEDVVREVINKYKIDNNL